jgi:hypothetical protein
VAVLISDAKAATGITFTFCVDDITGTGLIYDPGANVETCDTHGAVSS